MRALCRIVATFAAASICLFPSEASDDTVQMRAVASALPSVVTIRAFGPEREEFGSGIIVASDGSILTALHVVRNAKVISVRLRDGRRFIARMSAQDTRSDLALLRPTTPIGNVTPATLGDDAELRLGEPLVVIGNPFGLGWSVSRGILSGRDRHNIMPGCRIGLLQTDAPINPGASGGALVNRRGEVVGLVNAILTATGSHQGVGFAVPSTEFKHALKFLSRGEQVRRAWLGVTVRANRGDPPGLVVLKVRGPAKKAGLRTDDIILRADGIRLREIAEMRGLLRERQPNTPIRLRIQRGAQLLDLWATTGTLTNP